MKIIKYGFVAGIASVTDMATLYILSPVLDFPYLVGTSTGFITGLIVNYLLSTKYVFNASRTESQKRISEFTAYALIGVAGLILSLLCMRIFVGTLGIAIIAAKIVTTVLVFFWNYFGRRALYERGGESCRS